MDVALIQTRSKRKQKRQHLITKFLIGIPYNLSNTNRLLSNIELQDVESFMFNASTGNFNKAETLHRTDQSLLQYPHLEKAIILKPVIHSEYFGNSKTMVRQPPHSNIYENGEFIESHVTYIVEQSTCVLIVIKDTTKDYFKVRFKSKRHDVARKSLLRLTFDYSKIIRIVKLAIKNFVIFSIIGNLFSSYLKCKIPCVIHRSWSFRNIRHGFLITWLLKQMNLNPLIIFCSNILIVIVAQKVNIELDLSVFVVTDVTAKIYLNNIEWHMNQHINIPIIIKESERKNNIPHVISFCPVAKYLKNQDNNEIKQRDLQNLPKDYIPTVSIDTHKMKETYLQKKTIPKDDIQTVLIEKANLVANNFRNTIGGNENVNFGLYQSRLFLADTSAKNSENEPRSNEPCLSKIWNEILACKNEVMARIFNSNCLDDKRICNSIMKYRETVKEMIKCPEFYKLFFKQLGKTLVYTLFSSVNVNF